MKRCFALHRPLRLVLARQTYQRDHALRIAEVAL